MEILSALLALCWGNPPVTGGCPSQRTSRVFLERLIFIAGIPILERMIPLLYIKSSRNQPWINQYNSCRALTSNKFQVYAESIFSLLLSRYVSPLYTMRVIGITDWFYQRRHYIYVKSYLIDWDPLVHRYKTDSGDISDFRYIFEKSHTTV